MRRAALLVYLGFPATVAVGAFLFALRYEAPSINMLVAYLLGGVLFYAAPHLLWFVIATLSRFKGRIWHAGFIGASVALASLLVLSFTFHDSSGLPTQWLAYWPLALVLQAVLVGAVTLFSRERSSAGA